MEAVNGSSAGSENGLSKRNQSPFSPAASARNQVTLADGNVVLLHRIGSGAFGELYLGIDKRTNSKVAVKLEKRTAQHPQLSYENKVYRLLHSGSNGVVVGIPRLHFYVAESPWNALGIELCGPTLEDLFNYCGRRFSLKTVCMLAHQMISRVEFVHSKGILHRDIKPENFVFGEGSRAHILYIIDFGLSKPYWDRRRQTHIAFCEGKSITGTVRYCSSWTHKGYEQGRRDDMESIGFIIVYLMSGVLPWQGTVVRDAAQKVIAIGEKKNTTTPQDLCRGLPEEILEYCTYCRKLNFTGKPDYNYLRGLFWKLAHKGRSDTPLAPPPSVVSDDGMTFSGECNAGSVGNEYDWMFDWFLKRRSEVGGSSSPRCHPGRRQH